MKIKKFLASFLTMCFVGMNMLPALAATEAAISDVPSDYWASKEINDVVSNKIMKLDENGLFNPEKPVTRVGFVQSLLKILSNDNLDVTIKNSFKDVSETYPAYLDILRSEQLGLVYGYPDKTFQPERVLIKAEVTSIISHITKGYETDEAVLAEFTDKSDIPSWALNAYIKTTKNGLYINYPDKMVFNPMKDLTRAEAAVLLHKLRNALGLVREEYKNVPAPKPVEKILGTEHLNVSKKALNNVVTITDMRKIVGEKNLLAVAFDAKFNSKTHQSGDIINFVVPQNLYTVEGTLVFPANTKMVAEIINIQSPKWFNKNARVDLLFRNIVLPDGRVMEMSAKPFTKDGLLKEGPWSTAGKLTLSTLTMGIVGAGAGVGFSFIAKPAAIGTGLAIGIPVGCTVGLVVGLVTKGLHYKTKAGEKILIELTRDASVYN